ncbi:MAG: ribose-5-phosphate isomerase RpiA [Planctomycetes bacterium]|nr:ribose-5-phosphate isomerase RpiA [Planctomycetota bacterium]
MITIAERALEFIQDGDVIGLGTGRAATAFVRALGERVRTGLRVRGVPTSHATAELATGLQIPLSSLDGAMPIDVTVDGADEVDPQLNLIKGHGGALVREKIVAAASKRLVILVGAEKLVPVLGSKGRLPVEVLPFGLALCSRRLAELGFQPVPRMTESRLFVSDNGNHILDCSVPLISNPAEFDRTICSIPGVIGTGLFIAMAHTVLVQDGDSVRVMERR